MTTLAEELFHPEVELRFVIHEYLQDSKTLYRSPEGQLQYRYRLGEIDEYTMSRWLDVPTIMDTVVLPSKTGGG